MASPGRPTTLHVSRSTFRSPDSPAHSSASWLPRSHPRRLSEARFAATCPVHSRSFLSWREYATGVRGCQTNRPETALCPVSAIVGRVSVLGHSEHAELVEASGADPRRSVSTLRRAHALRAYSALIDPKLIGTRLPASSGDPESPPGSYARCAFRRAGQIILAGPRIARRGIEPWYRAGCAPGRSPR